MEIFEDTAPGARIVASVSFSAEEFSVMRAGGLIG